VSKAAVYGTEGQRFESSRARSVTGISAGVSVDRAPKVKRVRPRILVVCEAWFDFLATFLATSAAIADGPQCHASVARAGGVGAHACSLARSRRVVGEEPASRARLDLAARSVGHVFERLYGFADRVHHVAFVA
jgi:hypothetical protein